MPPTPEERARIDIDRLLTASGWVIQDRDAINLSAGRGIAVRELPMHGGEADYGLYIDDQPVGALEAKPAGATLSGVAEQVSIYAAGLPFQYVSTGVETIFRDNRDPQPRSRPVFTFHRPEHLADLLRTTPGVPPTLRGRFQTLPPLITTSLWDAQIEAITNLEASLAADKPRALIQMATGSGKTFTAVNAVYRLIKFGGARRVLFLVDRANLARQAEKEFRAFTTPDDGRHFSDLYNIQRLQTNAIDPVNNVIITTIQRLFSILSGEAEFDAAAEETSLFDLDSALPTKAKEVRYNPRLPIEFFDLIIVDECHRSIYNLWRGVFDYFDAHLIGLTATPSAQTLGFFDGNLVMEYSRQRAVADGVNVDGILYRIHTRISDNGNTIPQGDWVTRREKATRKTRLERLDADFEYDSEALNREVVAPNQIRAILQHYKDNVSALFDGRDEVPKTLIFAVDDAHAEEIVRIAREVFGRGDDFCKKITYRVTGIDPERLITEFRTSYYPRIAVTVDMIATGTDIKAIEVLIFMRAVRSRILFDQMMGRGTRIISDTDLQAVTGAGVHKDHFLIIDAIGITEQPLVETHALERKKNVPFAKLMQAVALKSADEDAISSLTGRLIRLEQRLTPHDRSRIAQTAGEPLEAIISRLVTALEPDAQEAAARAELPPYVEPTEAQIQTAADRLLKEAALPLASKPDLRNLLIQIQQAHEQVIDTTLDVVTSAQLDDAAAARARQTIDSFRQFIQDHKDEITALRILYSQPRGRLTYAALRELADLLHQPPHTWTTEALWSAFNQLERDRVHGVGDRRVLTDLVSLVRHALALEPDLTPYPWQVQTRYQRWLADQQAAGQVFTPAQHWWLDQIAEHIAVNLQITPADFNDDGYLVARGGWGAAKRDLGERLPALMEDLNQTLNASGKE